MTTLSANSEVAKKFYTSDLPNKVPSKITLFFWIVKCCATTVGETLSDYFNVNLGLGLGGAAGLFFPLLLINLCVQFWYPKYQPPIYWLAVVLMSVCGTIFTDGFHDNLGVELWIEIVVFFFLMCCAFGAWYRSEGSLDIHGINTPRRECFYWLSILFTFALGTALGDIVAETAGLGYGVTLALFAGIIVFIGLLWRFKALDEVTAFWFAYIMTRPLGAATGDLISVPKSTGGGGLGAGGTSGLFSGIIILCVAYLVYSGADQHGDVQPVATNNEEEDEESSGRHQEIVAVPVAVTGVN
jgi:uncharacterized membrane-anchored protein